MNAWQPIETAPKDGTAVLVMRDNWPGTETGHAETCCGHNTYVAEFWDDEGEHGEWICYMSMVREPACPVTPTHWMPLPLPPSVPADNADPMPASVVAVPEGLRDDLAGRAMEAIITGCMADGLDYPSRENTAVRAYAYADAMLAESAK